MDTRDLDLNLLATFDALLQEGSVSGAARRLGLSQPAVSYALARLRTLFADPLFVRVHNRMTPTPAGAEMGAAVQRALRILREEVLQRAPFVASSAERAFSLCVTDVSEFTLVPALVERLSRTAPAIPLRLQSVPAAELPAAMGTGAIDLAIGYFPELHESLYQQTLYESSFTCIARRGNPFTADGLNQESFCAAPHVAMKVRNRLGIIEKDLRAAGIERRIKVTVQHFHSMSGILDTTDMIAVVPLEVAGALARSFDAQTFELPYAVSGFEVRQYWHDQFHRDPANQWIRGELRDLFQRGGAPSPPPGNSPPSP